MEPSASSGRRIGIVLALACAAIVCVPRGARAQGEGATAAAGTRAGRISAQEREKAAAVKAYEPNSAELWVKKLEEQFITGSLHWHPFFDSAYSGGGFTLGAGYLQRVGSYSGLDVRGSYTPSGYIRLESEFIMPRLFDRRGTLSVLAGWREATQVGFYGIGTGNTSSGDRANYSFRQPYTTAMLTVRPTRKWLVLTGGIEYSQWQQRPGEGSVPSVEEVYSPETLPGLGAKPTYVHGIGGVALDWRPGAGYARRGGYYGVTVHDYMHSADQYGFRQAEYEAIQHIPIMRDAWVLSLHARVDTTDTKDGQQIPFFMLPALGGGSSLRGFPSWRFRGNHSVLVQAEWRVLVNSFFDTAIFYDAGKVTERRSELDLTHLKSDFGLGFRVHGPAATPLRIEFAKSNEGFSLIFAASAAF